MMGAPGLPLSGRVVSTRFGLTVAASGWFGSAHEIRRGEARAGVVPMIIGTIIFVVIAAILCAAALLALLGVGLLALSGPAALERDGLARGQAAPAWSLRDATGTWYASPPGAPLQLVIFADHSLRSFPEVVAGLRSLRDEGVGLE